jgi:hypothetical protein
VGTRAAVRRPLSAVFLAGVTLALVLFEHLAVPLPLVAAEAPEIYPRITAEPGDFTVLELPVGWRNSYGIQGMERTLLQSYQTVHGKRLVNGNISRNPDYKFAYFQRLPVIGTLAALEAGERPAAGALAVDREAAGPLSALLDLRYLVVHHAYVDAETEEYARARFGGEQVYADGAVTAYRLQAGAAPARVDLGGPAADVFLGRGWSDAETVAGRPARWIEGQPAEVYWRPAADARRLRLTARALPYANRPPQTLTVMLNERSIGAVTLADDWATYALALAQGQLNPGLNLFRLQPAGSAQPSAVTPADPTIGGTGMRAPLPLEVESAGILGGNFARVRLGDRVLELNGRGYNLVALAPDNGQVIIEESFDTFAGEGEAARLAGRLRDLPAGTIVLLAVRDDASSHLTAEAVAAIGDVGGEMDLRGKYRWGHALIGVKGARPGTAIERSAAGGVRVRAGRGDDDRFLAAAVADFGTD